MTLRHLTLTLTAALVVFAITAASLAGQITTASQPAQLDIRPAGRHSIRVTLKPLAFEGKFPYTPALAERKYPDPVISLREISAPVKKQVGILFVEVQPDPLRVIVTNAKDLPVQDVIFDDEGNLTFKISDQPILGMGEGGPQPGQDWRNQDIEFDRRGRIHKMRPRWQSDAYGSRNPVALMIGTEGWGLFIATPWGQIDLQDKVRGKFTPWQPLEPPVEDPNADRRQRSRQQSRFTAEVQGRPPIDSITPGVYDFFIFDANEPADLMKDISVISGQAVLPPKWSLGYMQSHRTLEDENKMINIVKTFREKKIPLDSVVYLGTGFCPRGWNTEQPSFDFNPEVFKSNPADVIKKLHDLNVKVAVHIVPWGTDKLPTLQGTIPPRPGETMDNSHILNHWKQHIDLSKPASTPGGLMKATGLTSSSASNAINCIIRDPFQLSPTFAPGVCIATATSASLNGEAGSGLAIQSQPGKPSKDRSPSESIIP